MGRWATAFVAVVFASCGGPSGRESSEEVVLRVSASDGLVKFGSGESRSGSTSYALELAYVAFDDHAEITSSKGVNVTIRRRAESPYDSRTLASTLRVSDQASAVADGELIQVTFESPEAAKRFVEQWHLRMFALGPFKVASEEPDRTRLVPRGFSRLDAIEIVSVPVGEQWRRLLAHEIDVVPNTPEVHRRQFAGMSSIRLIDTPVVTVMALLSNTNEPSLREVSARRKLASVIDPEAVARIACEDPSSAPKLWEVGYEDIGTLPPELHLLIHRNDAEFMEVAKVLSVQLREAGVRLHIASAPISEYTSRVVKDAGFQLALVPLPLQPEAAMQRVARFHSPASYRSAIAQKDYAKAREILRSEAFMIPLYERRQFAAVDRRFCGGKPKDPRSWRWLADLYPCEAEAR